MGRLKTPIRARKTARAARRGREEIKRILYDALRREFPTDTVDVSDGYRDNIHLMVVSRRFDELDERIKQELLWTVIDKSNLTSREKELISLVYPISPAEIK